MSGLSIKRRASAFSVGPQHSVSGLSIQCRASAFSVGPQHSMSGLSIQCRASAFSVGPQHSVSGLSIQCRASAFSVSPHQSASSDVMISRACSPNTRSTRALPAPRARHKMLKIPLNTFAAVFCCRVQGVSFADGGWRSPLPRLHAWCQWCRCRTPARLCGDKTADQQDAFPLGKDAWVPTHVSGRYPVTFRAASARPYPRRARRSR